MTTEDFHRKLTAILSADVVGYSRLMGDDEAATVKTLETYKGVMSSLIRQHRGRVVDSPGDNLLAEFGSVVDAVQCAVSIQKELQTRNADLPENRRMEFRVGINLGDVIEEDDRIYGDGVNIAARLEALADPGGICISKTAFDYIENKLPFGYRFIGEQTVKNIARPIGAYKVLMETRLIDEKEQKAKAPFWQRKSVLSLGIIVILAIAAVLYWNFYSRKSHTEVATVEPEQIPTVTETAKTQKTIAVLPFTDLSPEKDQEYFVDGLSEEILNSLCQIPDLTVIARTSSFSFKGTKKKIQEIAGELGVAHILEGSVRKDGNDLRITAQLVKAVDGSHLWSKTYDRKLKDIFAVQEDIATSVADELKTTLGVGKYFKQLGGTDNVEAYDLFLVARGIQYQGVFENISRKLKLIDEIIELDPEFALAWVIKAQTHILSAAVSPTERVDSEYDSAQRAALRAIAIEPELADAYVVLGSYRGVIGDFIEAELAFHKALEMKNEPLSTKVEMAQHYLNVGHFKKAHDILKEELRKDPINDQIRDCYVLSLGLLGDMQGAEEEFERCKKLFGDQPPGTVPITYLRLDTNKVLSRDKILDSDLIDDTSKAYLDSPEEALAELRRIYNDYDKLTDNNLADMSMWAAYFGDPEFAMDAMERSVSIEPSRTDVSVLWTIWPPHLREVRQLPRFKEFVKEIGLVDYWNKFGWPDLCHPTDNGDFECD